MRHAVREMLYRFGYSHCHRCMRVLPLDAFRRDTARSYGVSLRCKECADGYRSGVMPEIAPVTRPKPGRGFPSVSQLQWLLERSGLAYCSRGHIKPRSEFYADSSADNGLHAHCKACRGAHVEPVQPVRVTRTVADLSQLELARFRVSWR